MEAKMSIHFSRWHSLVGRLTLLLTLVGATAHAQSETRKRYDYEEIVKYFDFVDDPFPETWTLYDSVLATSLEEARKFADEDVKKKIREVLNARLDMGHVTRGTLKV